jgi:hypothetical protein
VGRVLLVIQGLEVRLAILAIQESAEAEVRLLRQLKLVRGDMEV